MKWFNLAFLIYCAVAFVVLVALAVNAVMTGYRFIHLTYGSLP